MSEGRGGYVKLHWSVKDSRQADSAQELGVWCWLLTSAALKPRTLKDGRTIERGQVLTSCRVLSERLQVPRQTINRYIKKWTNDGAILVEKVGRNGTILTLCNFDTYQPPAAERGTRRSQIETASEPNSDRIERHTEKPKKPKSPKSPKSVPPAASPTATVEDAKLRGWLDRWFGYKATRRDKYQPDSIDILVRKAVRESQQHGVDAVCEVIETSIANGYAGITWDRLSRGSPGGGGNAAQKTRGQAATERFLARHSDGDGGMRGLGGQSDLRSLRPPSG